MIKKFPRIFILVPALAMLAVIAFAGWYQQSLRPVGKIAGDTLTINIQKGERTSQIAQKLQQKDIIRSRNAFTIYLLIHGKRGQLQAGTYTLSRSDPTGAIVAVLVSGQVDRHKIQIPEGTTIAELIKLAERQGISAADIKTALLGTYPHDFLAGRPSGASLEGFLFPDTYDVSETDPAVGLITDMLDNFAAKVDQAVIDGFKSQGLNLYQGITLASILEKEATNESDRKVVAGVFYNRLRNQQALESDVTVEYGGSLIGKPFSRDLESPYNTYKYPGLPFGPIASPGLESILAAAQPATTEYFYFIAGRDCKTYFAKTFTEHQQNITKHGLVQKDTVCPS